MDEALRRVTALARQQYDVVTRTQATALGFDDSRATRFVAEGRWQREFRGVFVVHGGPLPWRTRALAALAHAGTGALLAYDAAAYLHGFTHREPGVIDVVVPLGRRTASTRDVRVHRSAVVGQPSPGAGRHGARGAGGEGRDPGHTAEVGAPNRRRESGPAGAVGTGGDRSPGSARREVPGHPGGGITTGDVGAVPALRLRATSPARTAIDIAAASRRTDDTIGALTRAIRAKVSVAALRTEVLARSNLRQRRLLLDLLTVAEAGIESPLELRYHRDVEVAHGLPRSVLQRRDVLGGQWVRADTLYEELGVRVELDGRLAHADRRGADAWRDNAVGIARRELTLRYHWEHVAGDACVTTEQLVEAFRSRGWRGAPKPCGPLCVLNR